MMYYNTREDDQEYNRGVPKPMKRQKSFEGEMGGKRYKDDKRKRREAFERKRGG